MAAVAVHGEEVIVVAVPFEVDDERRAAVHPERSGGEEGALGALRGAVAEHPARRAAGGAPAFMVVGEAVEVPLHLHGRVQRLQAAELARREPEVRHSTLCSGS